MPTAIDWSTKPPPWCWIGPHYRQQCEAIMSGAPGKPPRPPVDTVADAGLRSRRMRLGMTQIALAVAAGVRPEVVWRTEKGLDRARLAHLHKTLDEIERGRTTNAKAGS